MLIEGVDLGDRERGADGDPQLITAAYATGWGPSVAGMAAEYKDRVVGAIIPNRYQGCHSVLSILVHLIR